MVEAEVKKVEPPLFPQDHLVAVLGEQLLQGGKHQGGAQERQNEPIHPQRQRLGLHRPHRYGVPAQGKGHQGQDNACRAQPLASVDDERGDAKEQREPHAVLQHFLQRLGVINRPQVCGGEVGREQVGQHGRQAEPAEKNGGVARNTAVAEPEFLFRTGGNLTFQVLIVHLCLPCTGGGPQANLTIHHLL